MVRQSYRPKRYAVLRQCNLVTTAFLFLATLGTKIALAQAPVTIEAVLRGHNAWPVPPASVQMTGTSTKKGVTVPFKITATRLEEVLTEYGDQKQVSSPKLNFQDDGKKATFARTPAGFSQLDVTGLFFLAQLQQRTIQVSLPERSSVKGAPASRVHVSNNRSEVHYGYLRVNDELDLYVNESGLLAGILRTYYIGDPIRYSLGYTFSDYRETAGVLLPYRIEVLLKGRVVETLDISQYQFDLPTPTSLFLPRRPR